MKYIQLGNIPLEWFTGVGELRSHDKLGNDITFRDLLNKSSDEAVSFERQVILAKRAERKEIKRLKQLGINYTSPVMGKGVSIKDLL